MRAATLLAPLILSGCSFGEVAGFYDLPPLPETIAAEATDYPRLLPEGQLSVAALRDADAETELAALARRADLARQRADGVEVEEVPAGIAATGDGSELLQRAERSRSRAGL